MTFFVGQPVTHRQNMDQCETRKKRAIACHWLMTVACSLHIRSSIGQDCAYALTAYNRLYPLFCITQSYKYTPHRFIIFSNRWKKSCINIPTDVIIQSLVLTVRHLSATTNSQSECVKSRNFSGLPQGCA